MATLLDSLMNAIHSVETRGYGSDGKYSAIGKPNKKGQKAYGKYQVMDFNIPAWTKEAMGRSLTPAQFLKSPEAQEAVAKTRMGTLLKKYGNAADVASVWFTGQPVSKAGNVKDVTGTTNDQYVKAVLAEMGQVSSTPQQQPQGAFANLKNAVQNLTGTNPALSYTRVSPGPSYTPTPAPKLPAPQPFQFSKHTPSTPPLLKRFSEKLGKVTTPFGGQTTQERVHPGVDIAGKMGTPVPSTTGGVVVGSDNGHVQGENNYGNSVLVKDPQGDTHRYSHLKQSYVPVGQRVRPGQVIGAMGNSGAAYSPSGMGDGTNLDYRIVNAYGQYKNPMTYLKNLI